MVELDYAVERMNEMLGGPAIPTRLALVAFLLLAFLWPRGALSRDPTPVAKPGPKAPYCEEKYLLSTLVAACDSECGIVDCGSGKCPTCPALGNVFIGKWASYKCDNGAGLSRAWSAIGNKLILNQCVK